MDPRRELCKSIKDWLDTQHPGKRNFHKTWQSVHGKENALHDQRAGTAGLRYRYMAFVYKSQGGESLFIKYDASEKAYENFNAEMIGDIDHGFCLSHFHL